VVAPLNIVANINPDEDGKGLVPNLLGRVSATIQASPTVTAHIFNADNGLDRRDLVENLLGEVVASVVAPLNIVANINPDEDGKGLVPNLLGRVSATIQASPTVTAHIFNADNGLDRRDLVENLLGEVVASVVAPLNIVANINPDEDGNGLVPNLLGRVSATIQASPTVTAHIFNAGSSNSGLFKKDAMSNGIYTERIDDAHVAIYVPLASFVKTKGQGAISSLVSAAGSGNVQVVNMSPTPTMPMSSAPTPATTTMPRNGGDDNARNVGTRVQRPIHIVRQEHVATIQSMFPDIPEAAIRADLARTGSPAVTSDNILRNGGTLPPPPATQAEQRAEAASGLNATADVTNRGRQGTAVSGMLGAGAVSSGVSLNATQSPLATRLGVSKAIDSGPLPAPPPKVWETDSEKRADILRKRKEFMLMEARKKYQERLDK
ncbi:hypothetical protein IWW57_005661, partial [Coemansia sp. S610]